MDESSLFIAVKFSLRFIILTLLVYRPANPEKDGSVYCLLFNVTQLQNCVSYLLWHLSTCCHVMSKTFFEWNCSALRKFCLLFQEIKLKWPKFPDILWQLVGNTKKNSREVNLGFIEQNTDLLYKQADRVQYKYKINIVVYILVGKVN